MLIQYSWETAIASVRKEESSRHQEASDIASLISVKCRKIMQHFSMRSLMSARRCRKKNTRKLCIGSVTLVINAAKFSEIVYDRSRWCNNNFGNYTWEAKHQSFVKDVNIYLTCFYVKDVQR